MPVSVIIPAYHAAATIAATVRGARTPSPRWAR